MSGTTHEVVEVVTGGSDTLFGEIDGKRSGSTVCFVKTFVPTDVVWGAIPYEGLLNGSADDIEGEWVIMGAMAGRFLMIRERSAEKAEVRSERVSA